MKLSVVSSSTIPARKEIHITDHLVYDILNYVHPELHLIIYYKMYQKDKKKQNHLRFNISSLISLNCIATLNEFERILMSFRFREHLAAIVSLHGDYSTILWFRDKEIFFDQATLCKNAARRGDLGLFKSFMNEFVGDIYDIHEMIHDACKAAAKFGSKNILEFILFEVLLIVPVDEYNFLYDEAATKVKMDHSFITDELRKIAALFGQLDVLELIHYDNRFPRNHGNRFPRNHGLLDGASLIFDAVSGNQMEVLLWIQRHRLHIVMASQEQRSDENVCSILCQAAENGNLCMVQWLAGKGFRSKDSLVTKSAAKGGNIDVLKFLLSLDCPMAEDVCIIAAENGHLELLKWAKLNSNLWQDALMFPAAAKSSREDLHQWLLELHCPFMENESFPIAYELMNFKFIKFALANGSTVWDDDLKYELRRTASLIGDLEVFKWAHSTACKDPRFLTSIQAYGGHVHILEWRRVHEFEFCWDKSALLTACKRGHIHVLEWAFDKYGCCDVIANECFQIALTFYRPCHLHLLSFIHDRWPNVLKCSNIWNRASSSGYFELCFWLYKHGCPFLPDTYKIAWWRDGNYALAKWLHSKEYPSSRWALKRTRRYIKQGF